MDLSFGLMLDSLNGDPQKYRDATPYAEGAVGNFFELPKDTKVWSLTGSKIFQLVKITSVTSAQKGAPLYWTSDPSVKEVTTAITNTGLIAGLLVNDAADLPAANDYIFMQVRGICKIFCKSSPTSNPTAIGDKFAVTGAAAGSVDSITTAPTGAASVLGRFVAASSGNELVKAILTVDLHP